MKFMTKRVDLIFTERYYTTPGDQPVKVRCFRCGGNIMFSKDQDDPKDRFYCYNSTATNGCFDKRRHEIDKMYPGSLASLLETEYAVDDTSTPVIVEDATDGVTRFGRTRPMNFSEKVNYHLKALNYLRDKAARGEKT